MATDEEKMLVALAAQEVEVSDLTKYGALCVIGRRHDGTFLVVAHPTQYPVIAGWPEAMAVDDIQHATLTLAGRFVVRFNEFAPLTADYAKPL